MSTTLVLLLLALALIKLLGKYLKWKTAIIYNEIDEVDQSISARVRRRERTMPAMTDVLNLSTGETTTYSCPPEEAVIAAHAQSLGDMNTWDYAEKYKDDVVRGPHTVACGDFTAVL